MTDDNNRDIKSIALSSTDVIHQIEPAIIPRISAVATIQLCERAAFNISFFGMESNEYTANGEIGNAIHRITIKSVLEIINLSKRGQIVKKEDGIEIFANNANVDLETNWKRFMLAGVDKPLDPIMEDLDIRADRLLDKLISEEQENKESLFRPEFTIRNIHLPLEGRLDLIRVKIPRIYTAQNYSKLYTTADNLSNLEKEHVEIIQIKSGRFKKPSAVWKLQADAETLLLMKALKLKVPPEYTWQFADKDSHRKKFNFEKVYEAISKYMRFWKSETSPSITGFCPNCSLKEGCLHWAFASSNTLTDNEIMKRKAEFSLSKRIRTEISLEDRWKVYVELRNPEQRQVEGSAITNLSLEMGSIDLYKQEVTLLGDKYFGQFIDFSVGDHITVSDGNPNLGSNPTATVIDIDLIKKSIRLRFHKGDLYYLFHEHRDRSRTLTLDRFNFVAGLTSMRFLDKFFRLSPYADITLQYRNSLLMQKAKSTDESNLNDSRHVE
jgi:hypothetical protein